MTTLTKEAYTVGWITALDTELVAAREMLDKLHSPIPRTERDDNSYTLGQIGAHNVVIACLPLGRIGKVPAAIVVKDMLRSFPNIEFGLLVGIGGGIPTKDMDMRLGDVAVSKPGYNDGGVVQYDYGQTVKKGCFVRSGTLNQPPSLLLTALDSIRAKHQREDREYMTVLQSVLQRPSNQWLSSPGAGKDRLFHAHYDHVGDQPNCDRCRMSKTKKRPLRTDPYPRVFYGTIASADRVIKHGPTRDNIGKEIGAICFEMEAAGLMNDFPCLVIRGICDYSDTHKNYQWQPYAALTAAAYAKELLQAIPPVASEHSGEKAISPANEQEVRPTTDAAPSNVTSQHSFFVIDLKVLQSPSVALGRLVTDVKAPWDEYCTETPELGESRVGISPEALLKDLLSDHNSPAFTSRLRGLFSTLLSTEDLESTAESVVGKSYYLTNQRKWLDQICGAKQVQQWIEEMIRIEWDVWLVVGIHTIPVPPALTSSTVQFGDAQSSGKEIVVAVQFRQVQFDWQQGLFRPTSRAEPSAHHWEPLLLTKAPTGTDQDSQADILEVYLQTHVDITDLAFSDAVFEECDRILVF